MPNCQDFQNCYCRGIKAIFPKNYSFHDKISISVKIQCNILYLYWFGFSNNFAQFFHLVVLCACWMNYKKRIFTDAKLHFNLNDSAEKSMLRFFIYSNDSLTNLVRVKHEQHTSDAECKMQFIFCTNSSMHKRRGWAKEIYPFDTKKPAFPLLVSLRWMQCI